MVKRSPRVYSTGKAAGLIALAGAAGWFAQVANHEAPDEFPNGRREEPAGLGHQLVRRSEAWIGEASTLAAPGNTTATSSELVPPEATQGEHPLPQWPSSKIIETNIAEENQSNSASMGRVSAPQGKIWQTVLIALGVILFLSSSGTAQAIHQEVDIRTPKEIQDRRIAASARQVDGIENFVKRGHLDFPSYLTDAPRPANAPLDPAQWNTSPWVESPHSNTQPELPPLAQEAFPPWDGRISRKDHEEAHERWATDRFQADLEGVSQRMRKEKAALKAGECVRGEGFHPSV